ncbi:DUF3592 domain-containing protein [Lentzea sp. NPDC003310]|uniref:DUF3592 domain-containing protein n=1 Tax=Lentzea sp. NPDC003310 TaxID=3154447 RepID=UPI0033A05EB4
MARALGVLVTGLVLLVLFGVGAVLLEDRGADLEARGTRVEGVVLAVQGGGRSAWTADVRYRADGQVREEQVALGDSGPTTRPGDRVTVIYDPADPGNVALWGTHNDPGWASAIMAVLAVGTVAGLTAGPVLLYRAVRDRRRAT